MTEIPPDKSGLSRVRRWLLGKPRDLADRSIFHQLSLIPFLAWVGLGADGLSSSAYGPPEAFGALGEHRWLAVAMAAMTAITVFIISFAYTRIIAAFPNGGGGYVVATKLLGPAPGLISGSALLVDYILTVTVSIAAAGDALFSFLPASWQGGKLVCSSRMKVSKRRRSWISKSASRSSSPGPLPIGTCPTTFAGRSLTSKPCATRMPLSPARIRFHTFSTPMPSGVTSPMPVMTTRLIGRLGCCT